MRAKILIITAVVLSFVGGVLLTRYMRPDSSNASQVESNPTRGTRSELNQPVSDLNRPAADLNRSVPDYDRQIAEYNRSAADSRRWALDAKQPALFTCDDGRIIVSTGRDGQTIMECVHESRYVGDGMRTPVAQRYVSRSALERERPRARKKRSWQKEALIIAGSAGAGTAIGAVAGGKKGAAIGAVSGGVAGLAYDLATRNKNK